MAVLSSSQMALGAVFRLREKHDYARGNTNDVRKISWYCQTPSLPLLAVKSRNHTK